MIVNAEQTSFTSRDFFLDAVHNLYNCHRQLEARRCNMIFMSTAVMSIRSCS